MNNQQIILRRSREYDEMLTSIRNMKRKKNAKRNEGEAAAALYLLSADNSSLSSYRYMEDVNWLYRRTHFQEAFSHADRTLVIVANNPLQEMYTKLHTVLQMAATFDYIPPQRYDFLVAFNGSRSLEEAKRGIRQGAKLLADESEKLEGALLNFSDFIGDDYYGEIPPEIVARHNRNTLIYETRNTSYIIKEIVKNGAPSSFDSDDLKHVFPVALKIAEPYLDEKELALYENNGLLTPSREDPLRNQTITLGIAYIADEAFKRYPEAVETQALAEKLKAIFSIYVMCAKETDLDPQDDLMEYVRQLRYNSGADYAIHSYLEGVPLEYVLGEQI